MPTSRIVLSAIFCVGLAACGAETAQAPGSPAEQAITARQANFEAIKEANDAMKAEAEAEAPDLALFQAEAATLLGHVEDIGKLFPEGSGPEAGIETEALAVIWENPTEFAKAAERMTEVAGQFLTIARGGDIDEIRAGLGELGETCRACHQQFRQKR